VPLGAAAKFHWASAEEKILTYLVS